MKKIKVKIIIVVISIIICSIVAITYSNNSNNGKFSAKAQEDVELNKLEELSKVNLKVNKLISYGNGPIVDGRNPTEKEILEYGEGHCGEYAYLFSKYISMSGIKSNVIDIHRFDGGSHSVVEVNLNNNKYVFDPTLGIYYEASISQLINNSNLDIDEVRVGEPTASYIYGKDLFFKGVQTCTVYDDVRDYYEINKIDSEAYTIKTNIKNNISVEKNEIVNSTKDEFLQFKFSSPIDIYRTKLYFNDMLVNIKKIKISYSDNNNKEIILYNDFVSKNSCVFEFTNKENVRCDNIMITFYKEANEDRVPDIDKIGIY